MQKLNSYFADFKQVGFFTDFEQVSYWHKNVISCFADFKQNKKMLVILLTLNKAKNVSYFANWHKNVVSYCKFHLKLIPINWTFKFSSLFWTSKPSVSSLLLYSSGHSVIQSEINLSLILLSVFMIRLKRIIIIYVHEDFQFLLIKMNVCKWE